MAPLFFCKLRGNCLRECHGEGTREPWRRGAIVFCKLSWQLLPLRLQVPSRHPQEWDVSGRLQELVYWAVVQAYFFLSLLYVSSRIRVLVFLEFVYWVFLY